MSTEQSAHFDAGLRARHAEALQRLSPQVLAQLAQRRHAALRGQPPTNIRHGGLRYAIAGFAAVGALALGLQLQRPAGLPLAPAATTAAVAASTPRNDTLLDQDPEFYAWLASPDARQLAME